jgi:hypothetical protein
MKYRNESGSSHVIIVIIIIVVILSALGFVFIKALNKKSDGHLGGSSIEQDCRGAKGTVQMKHSPMDLNDVGSIIPTGMLAGPHVTPIDHLYFYPKDMKNRDAAPVYAMADGFITGYSVRTQNVQGGEQKPEYRLFIQHSCDFYSYFDLMTSLDSSIASQMKEGDMLHVPIKAGQVLGRVGAQSLDTAIYNYAMTLPGFVNPESYAAEDWKIHTDDFFKYFDEPLRTQMLALNPRKVEPYGGKIDYDVKDKLQGNWFEEGTNGYAGPTKYQNGQNPDGKGYWAGHFSIAPDAVNVDLINISFGDYQGQATQFTALSATPDPATVGTADGIVKYELTRYVQPTPSPTGSVPARNMTVLGTVLLQVLDGDKMKMEAFPNKTASEVTAFTGSAKVYSR